MTSINKNPQVIRDLIELATYIAVDNIDASDRFLTAAEATFNQLAKMPKIGKLCQFSHPNLADIRQYAIKDFRKYIIFYRSTNSGIEVLRVIHGTRDFEAILEEFDENE